MLSRVDAIMVAVELQNSATAYRRFGNDRLADWCERLARRLGAWPDVPWQAVADAGDMPGVVAWAVPPWLMREPTL